jgi:hypothetical protein
VPRFVELLVAVRIIQQRACLRVEADVPDAARICIRCPELSRDRGASELPG